MLQCTRGDHLIVRNACLIQRGSVNVGFAMLFVRGLLLYLMEFSPTNSSAEDSYIEGQPCVTSVGGNGLDKSKVVGLIIKHQGVYVVRIEYVANEEVVRRAMCQPDPPAN
jgi:hypothetical protein